MTEKDSFEIIFRVSYICYTNSITLSELKSKQMQHSHNDFKVVICN